VRNDIPIVYHNKKRGGLISSMERGVEREGTPRHRRLRKRVRWKGGRKSNVRRFWKANVLQKGEDRKALSTARIPSDERR